MHNKKENEERKGAFDYLQQEMERRSEMMRDMRERDER
jgi:DNA segregation ATPase FtsK/SpoIIIE-like protein